MKKFCVLVLGFVAIVFVAINLPSGQNVDYLRLHIRANSNLSVDQNVKYEIRTMLVDMLTPYLCNVSSKEQAINIINNKTQEIELKCNNLLMNKGFAYKSKVKINNEYFPTRTYNNTTLESGYYDAVIVELGDATGDNWWCVMYPPLCFVNKNENNNQIKYKSKIVEWFEGLFKQKENT